jgi:hypothetical protein
MDSQKDSVLSLLGKEIEKSEQLAKQVRQVNEMTRYDAEKFSRVLSIAEAHNPSFQEVKNLAEGIKNKVEQGLAQIDPKAFLVNGSQPVPPKRIKIPI